MANVFGVPVDRLDVPGSATIGAAMRAAHAIGIDLDDLESKFSQTKEGSTIEPEEGAFEIYNEMLPKFAQFVSSQS